MKKYSIQPLVDGFDAMSKAKQDACKILKGEGYEPFETRYLNATGNLQKGLLALQDMLRILLLPLKGSDIFLVQWPMYTKHVTGIFYWVMRLKCRHLYLLVHDLDTLRGKEGFSGWTMKFIQRAERVIVHTPAMRDYLVERGVSGEKLRVLECFDYLTDGTKPVERERERAGGCVCGQFVEECFFAEHGGGRFGVDCELLWCGVSEFACGADV